MAEEEYYTCPKCRKRKPISEFPRYRGTEKLSRGFVTWECKQCSYERGREFWSRMQAFAHGYLSADEAFLKKRPRDAPDIDNVPGRIAALKKGYIPGVTTVYDTEEHELGHVYDEMVNNG